MKRILLMVFRNIILIPYMWIKLNIYAKHIDRYSGEQIYKMLRFIVNRANKGGNVNVKGYGNERLPKEDGFILYPNHQGMYDVLAILSATDRYFSVVPKSELMNIQFLKQVFQCVKAKPIVRDDLRQSMTVIKEVSKDVKSGKNYVIFAEGTRSKLGNKMLEMKGGSFKAATMARCPIVPVALINCFVPFDSDTIKNIDVEVHFLEPIYYEEYATLKTGEIAELVQERINLILKDY